LFLKHLPHWYRQADKLM